MRPLAAHFVAFGLAVAAAPLSGRCAEIAELLQGTNLTFALAPDRATLVVGLADQLWRLPVSGGGAEALTPSDEPARWNLKIGASPPGI